MGWRKTNPIKTLDRRPESGSCRNREADVDKQTGSMQVNAERVFGQIRAGSDNSENEESPQIASLDTIPPGRCLDKIIRAMRSFSTVLVRGRLIS